MRARHELVLVLVEIERPRDVRAVRGLEHLVQRPLHRLAARERALDDVDRLVEAFHPAEQELLAFVADLHRLPPFDTAPIGRDRGRRPYGGSNWPSRRPRPRQRVKQGSNQQRRRPTSGRRWRRLFGRFGNALDSLACSAVFRRRPSPSKRMNHNERRRRALVQASIATIGCAAFRPFAAHGAQTPLTRPIPSTGEALPVIGLGSWITFNVGDDRDARDQCAAVMRAFFERGGRVIDSSPMYGSSQDVIGYGLGRLARPAQLFAADKVWIAPAARGPAQIERSRQRWNIERFDLVQVHNLLAWEEHLRTLFEMKAAGRVRYVGITTSEGRRHREVEQIMRSHPIDFVQITYNVLDREVEQRILPLARDRAIAVLVNRPFREGALIDAVIRHPLPGWAAEIDCANWAQLLLKFVVAHPAVTCAIPATSDVAH